jgi:hypothetical protein
MRKGTMEVIGKYRFFKRKEVLMFYKKNRIRRKKCKKIRRMRLNSWRIMIKSKRNQKVRKICMMKSKP